MGYFQTHAGMRVDGRQVSFRSKADRLVAIGSEAVPNLDTAKVHPAISETLARTNAKKWLAHREWTWPEDQGESHQTGQIIGGALWDLRTYFRQTYGYEEGTRIVDGFWYAALQRASGILAVYPELLVQDDDDGDLSNGTPNLCAITDIFRRAGLTDGTQAGLTIAPPGAGPVDRHSSGLG